MDKNHTCRSDFKEIDGEKQTNFTFLTLNHDCHKFCLDMGVYKLKDLKL